ncbi:MAG: thioredoxin family protein [Deltaproteobacteria bacterium]|nr:thioredoxin family protein [Deltaproteobacteria bacterium]MBW2208899.1 thioredoxin family protein [Deltaproteobacteria bacterium]
MVIRVLGQGCIQCDQLEQNVMEVLSELDLPADLEHVRDIQEIGKYGVMGTPALLINGKVMCVGRVPPKLRIREWLANKMKEK